MANAMLPALARLTTGSTGEAGGDEPNRLVRQGFGLLAAFATLAFACFWPLGGWLLGLIRDVYREQHAVLLLLSAGIAFEVCRLLVDQLLMASRHVRVVAWAEVVRYVLLILVAPWCIAQWGAMGAAAAVVFSMLINFVVKIVAARRLMGLRLVADALGLAGLILAIAAVGVLEGYAWLTLGVWLAGVAALRFVRPRQLWYWRATGQG
jgi:O-antigen/teichoic acid export membrane protein